MSATGIRPVGRRPQRNRRGVGKLEGRALRILRVVAAGALAPALALDAVRGQGYPLLQIDGTAPYELFGTSVAGVGDVNGDGVPDILVGAPGADPGGLADAGSARVHSGADGALLASIVGLAPGDAAGMSVASAGDLDGDGIAEWIVGAPQDGNGGPGYVRVFSGASGAILHTFSGSLPGDRFGAAVASAGPIVLGTTSDLIVGAPRQGAGAPAGYARVFSGSDGTPLLALNGSAPGDSFGYAVGAMGDLDGDAFGDVIVGAPTDPQGGFAAGSARVFSGSNGSVLRTVIGAPGAWAGHAVLGPGDVDLDGTSDYIVGLPRGSSAEEGLAVVLSGTYGTVMQGVDGSSSLDWFGASLAIVGGDLGADGFFDWIVGAPESPLAGGAGYARVFPGIPISDVPVLTLQGPSPGDAFGWSVSGPGDVDGDGLLDVAVGAPGADPLGAALAGSVHVFSVAGVPPGSSLFGAGCPGPGGEVPRISALGGSPVLGPAPYPATQSFSLLVTKVPPGRVAVLITGFSNQSWGPSPLPLGLGFLGLPSCSLLVAPVVLTTRVTSGIGPFASAAAVALPLPTSTVFVGTHVYFQWYVVDPGPLVVPGSMSAGLDLLLL